MAVKKGPGDRVNSELKIPRLMKFGLALIVIVTVWELVIRRRRVRREHLC